MANSTGDTTFNGAVGNTNALTSLTTNAGGTTHINGGSVETTGDQTYGDDVQLGNDTTLEAGAGDITFEGTLDGLFFLVANSTGDTTFNAAVGNTNALTSLTTNAGRTTHINGGSVETTGDQTYGDDVQLGNDTTLEAGAGDITFEGTLDGLFFLVANSTGDTTFNGAVGNTNALTSLTTNAGGTTHINGGSVETTGDQTYGDDVQLGNDTTLEAGAGDITFEGTLDGLFFLVANSTGDTTFNGAVGTRTR